MATITPQATPIAGGWLVGWFGCAAGDSCTPWPNATNPQPNDVATLTDRSVQLYGGTTGTFFLEGSNHISLDIATFATLHHVDGTTAMTLTAAGIRQVLEATYFTRPVFTAASSGTNVLMKFTINSARF